MSILHPTRVSASIFSWKGNDGVCEISDFGPNFRFDRVYDDACDEGITVVGREEEIVFVVVEYIISNDGDLQGWKLASINGHGRRFGRFTVTMYND